VTVRLALYGAGGRMGLAIAKLAAKDDAFTLVGAIDHHGSPHLGRDLGEIAGVGNLGVAIDADAMGGLLGADVVIDFSIAPAFDTILHAAASAGVPLVSGTTRLTEASQRKLEEAAEKLPILWAPNMSVGVQVMAQLVRQAVGQLGLDYDVEIVETHHNRKTDAPSGTATFLQEAAQSVRQELKPVHGREGQVGAREPNEIGVHAVRGGGVIGDHSVHLIGPFDRIEINHRAIGRELFAAGALRAARWLADRRDQPGHYRLADTLT